MKNITRRSIAMLLFVVMLFSCCQGALVSTFAAEVEESVSTTTPESSMNPELDSEGSEDNVHSIDGSDDARLEAEVVANVNLYNDLEYFYEGVSGGYAVGGHQIENAFQLELFEDLETSSLKYMPYVKFNLFAQTEGTYELVMGVVVEELSSYKDFYIPVLADGKAYKATCSKLSEKDDIYRFSVSVDLRSGKNSVYLFPFDAMTYLNTVNFDTNAVSKTEISFDYLIVPGGVSCLAKDEVVQNLLVPSISISDPSGRGGIATLGTGGSEGSGTGGSGGGSAIGGNPDYKGGWLNETNVGVTMQVVYYNYKDVYNAELMYNQIINSVKNYGTSSDNAMNASGQKLNSTTNYDRMTIFYPYFLSDHLFFYNSQTKSTTTKGSVFKYPASSFPSNYPENRVKNSTWLLRDNVFDVDSNRVKDTEVSNFLKRIILGDSYGYWDISDVADSSSPYAKTLTALGVASSGNGSVKSYLDAYQGKLSLIAGVDANDDGVEDVNTRIPVIIWKYIVHEANAKNPDTGAGVNKSFIYVPADVANACADPSFSYGNHSSTAAVTWWKTAYEWKYSKTQTTYDGDTVYKYTSSVFDGLGNAFNAWCNGWSGHPKHAYCGWDPSCSYFCKAMFGTGHVPPGHGHSSYSWEKNLSDPMIIGSGYVNAIGSEGYTKQDDNKGWKAYHFRGFWAPFGTGYGSIKIEKHDGTNSSVKLEGATFDLYRSWSASGGFSGLVSSSDFTNNTPVTTDTGYVKPYRRTTNSSGIAVYSNLRSGVYYLREISAPNGYISEPDNPIMVNVTAKGTTTKPVPNTSSGMYLQIEKTTSTACGVGFFQNHPMYSFAGAEYSVYRNGVFSEVIVLNADGEGSSSKQYNPTDTITLKETKAPKGYELDTRTHTVDTTKTTTVNSVVHILKGVYDYAIMDPVTFNFKKVNKSGVEVPEGNCSFEGAVFRIDYYKTALNNNGVTYGTPERTWYFKTDSSGMIKYDANYFATGYDNDSLYRDYNGRPTLPLGSIKVTEEVAPTGYGKVPTLYADIKEVSGDADVVWSTSSMEVVESEDGGFLVEEPLGNLAAFSVRKIDKELWEKAVMQGDIPNLKATFRVINLSTNPVKIGDFDEAGNGEVCFTFETSTAGFYQSEAVFPVGKYRIEEVTPPTGMLLNSTWYKEFEVKSTTTNGYIFNFSSTVEKSCPDDIFRGGFTIYKVDNDRFDSEHANIQNPQGGASFVGTQFVVYNRSTNPVVVNGTTYAVGDICYSFTMTTESGVYTSASNILPYGTYEIKESVAGPGYDVNEDWSATFSIRKNGVIVEANSRTNNPLEEPIHRGDLTVIKLDQETNWSHGQGDATLAGAIVQVVNNNTYAVYTDRDGNGNYAWYSKGQVCLYITFNENGNASTAGKEAYKEKKALPYGSYIVSEYAPSEGYKINSTWSKIITINASTSGVHLVPTNNHLPEPVIRGGFAVYKVDKDRYEFGNSSLQNPQGSATFKGTVFAVYNRSKNSVRVNGKDYNPNDVCYTFTMDSASGEFESAVDLLPYGTYEIKELTAPTGYVKNSTWSATFSIREDGVIVNANTRTDNPCVEQVIRGGVEFNKVDADAGKGIAQGNATLAGAMFQVITFNTYGVYTDSTGDGTMEMHGKGTVCLYLYADENGVVKSASNALPYGTYIITERSAPTGYKLNEDWSITITISKNGVIVKSTVDVEEPVIRGGFSVYKVDADRYKSWVNAGGPADKIADLSKPQGGAKLVGTRFAVKNLSDNAVYIKETDTWYNSGEICYSFTIGATGSYTSSKDLLPYGKYEIFEQTPGMGYLLNKSWSVTISITEDGKIVPANQADTNPAINTPIRGGVKLFKIDNDTSKSSGQGEASLAGAVIAITNDNYYAVYTDKWGTGEYKWYGNGAVCLILTVDSNGQATSTSTALPYGDYKAYEQEAPEGYLLNEDWEISFSITTNDYIRTLTGADLILKDPVIRGGVRVEKFDELLGVNTAAGCNLSGITFSVYSNNAQPVKIGGVTYSNGARVATMHLSWNEGEGKWMSQLDGSILPYGTYTIKENKKSANSAYANDSYLWSDLEYTFSIRNDKEIVEVDTSNNPIVYQNLPVGRIDLLKVNQRNVSLAGVKMCLEWSEDGSEWTPVQSIAAETFTPGGSTTQGIVDGCLVTNQTGELSYTGLDPRLQYRLTEVETLNGYSLLNGPVFTGTLKANENSQWTQKYKVVNADIFKLPEVGSYDMVIIPFIFAICVTVSTVALVHFKKKKKGITNA